MKFETFFVGRLLDDLKLIIKEKKFESEYRTSALATDGADGTTIFLH